MAYNRKTKLQKKKLRDYASAEKSCKMLINLLTQLSYDNLESQKQLAIEFQKLAKLQKGKLNDYASAEKNYQKSIEILERLAQDNHEYYAQAITAINAAIDVAFLLKKDSKYLPNWLCYRYQWTKIQYNNGKELDQVKRTLLEIKPLVQQCLTDDHDNKSMKEVNDGIDELLSKITPSFVQGKLSTEDATYSVTDKVKTSKDATKDKHRKAIQLTGLATHQAYQLNDYASAETNYKSAIEIIKELPQERHKFQSYLAINYRHLAYTYNKQNKFEQAITAINAAIDVALRLKEKDSKYLPHWLSYRYYRAEIQYNNGKDLDKVKNTLLEIKPLVQQCIKDYPDNDYNKEVNDGIERILSTINA